MQDFLKAFDEKRQNFPMHLEIYYSKFLSWTIHIWRKGCGENGEDVEICFVQDVDMQLCFAKAHIALQDWFRKNGGVF